MAYLAADKAYTRCTLKNASSVVIHAGDGPFLPYDTVVYDPCGQADVANDGISVTKSGLYIASFTASINTGDGSSGMVKVWPNCRGAAGPDLVIQTPIAISAPAQYSLTWLFYMNVPAPDVFTIECDNNTAVNVGVGGYEVTLARLPY